MVVNPSEVLKLTNEEQNRALELEERIDHALKTYFGRHSKDYLEYDLPEKTTKPIIDKIKRSYSNSGWKVDYKEDSRERSTLTFRIDHKKNYTKIDLMI